MYTTQHNTQLEAQVKLYTCRLLTPNCREDMINISSTTPSTIFCTSHFTIVAAHPQSYHACANSKLISYRRHLPVLHSDPSRGKHPGHAHGHIPPAGITNRNHSTRTLAEEPADPAVRARQNQPSTRQATTFDLCRMRLTNPKATDAPP